MIFGECFWFFYTISVRSLFFAKYFSRDGRRFSSSHLNGHIAGNSSVSSTVVAVLAQISGPTGTNAILNSLKKKNENYQLNFKKPSDFFCFTCARAKTALSLRFGSLRVRASSFPHEWSF
jgi:hypothetical protein